MGFRSPTNWPMDSETAADSQGGGVPLSVSSSLLEGNRPLLGWGFDRGPTLKHKWIQCTKAFPCRKPAKESIIGGKGAWSVVTKGVVQFRLLWGPLLSKDFVHHPTPQNKTNTRTHTHTNWGQMRKLIGNTQPFQTATQISPYTLKMVQMAVGSVEGGGSCQAGPASKRWHFSENRATLAPIWTLIPITKSSVGQIRRLVLSHRDGVILWEVAQGRRDAWQA